MTGLFRVSRLHLRRLEELGIGPDAVTHVASLPHGWWRTDRPLLDTEQLFAFWRAVGSVSGDPLFGLRLGSEARIEPYDPIALAVLSSSTFRDAIERLGRYKRLVCPEEIRLTSRAREARVEFRWLQARDTVPPILQDLCFAWLVTLGRLGTGHPLTPVRIEFARSSGDRRAYESHFGCPVRWNAGRDVLVLDAGDLDRPFRTRNTDLLAMIAPQLDAELVHQERDEATGHRTKSTVKRLLAGRRPGLRDVARELGVSTRTLQRRLGEDGVTYQRIVEDARRELAHHYLLQSSLDLSETAYLLGYDDPNSFVRAFHQWEGVAPGRWRQMRRAPS